MAMRKKMSLAEMQQQLGSSNKPAAPVPENDAAEEAPSAPQSQRVPFSRGGREDGDDVLPFTSTAKTT
jgi:hypothetical protein